MLWLLNILKLCNYLEIDFLELKNMIEYFDTLNLVEYNLLNSVFQ